MVSHIGCTMIDAYYMLCIINDFPFFVIYFYLIEKMTMFGCIEVVESSETGIEFGIQSNIQLAVSLISTSKSTCAFIQLFML